MEENSFEARLLHTPYEKPDAYGSLAMPVYNTAAYEFESAEAMEAAFCGRTSDHAYSRITNPTVQYFEDRVLSVTGVMSVTALNSGMAAICNTLMTIGRGPRRDRSGYRNVPRYQRWPASSSSMTRYCRTDAGK